MLRFEIKRIEIVESKELATGTYIASALSSRKQFETSKTTKAIIGNFALRYYTIVEEIIAKQMGAQRVPIASGYGFQPDIIYLKEEPEFGEIKTTTILTQLQEIDGRRQVGFKISKGIKLASKDISITPGQPRYLAEEYTDEGKVKLGTSYDVNTVNLFVRRYKGKGADRLRKDLLNPDSAGSRSSEITRMLHAIRNSIVRKAQNLYLPLSINGTQTAIAALQFNADDILKSTSLRGSISESSDGKDPSINISFTYPESTIQEALNQIAASSKIKAITDKFSTEYLDYLQSYIVNRMSDMSIANPLGDSIIAMEQSLNLPIGATATELYLRYNKGSIITYQGILNYIRTKIAKIKEPTRFIDITLAVQDHVSGRMKSGGQAEPPIMTNRTGTFVESIKAIADLRRKTVNYYFMPKYIANERYGYLVNQFVGSSIRAVASKEFSSAFTLKRTKF